MDSCFLLNGLTTQAKAELSISDSPSYDFGNVTAGSTANHTFTATNTGTKKLSISSGGALALPFNYGNGSFPGGGSCTVNLNFEPRTELYCDCEICPSFFRSEGQCDDY